jgi:hypothetical protein
MGNNNNNNKMMMKTNNRDNAKSPDAERRELANKLRPGKGTNKDRTEKNTRARMGNNSNNNNKMMMKTNNRDNAKSPDAERRELANKLRPGKSTNKDRTEKSTRARMGNNSDNKMRMNTNNKNRLV